MRQRLITAAIAIPFGVVVLFFYNTVIFNAVVALIIFTAVFEVLIATRYVRDKALFVICAVFAVAVPFLPYMSVRRSGAAICFCYILALFVYMLAKHKTTPFSLIGTVFLLTLLLSFSMSCLVYVRDLFSASEQYRGLFYIVLMLFGAWITDAGAYFIGVFFGRHKLAPEISPKKTVEGLIGGFVFSLIAFIGAALIYSAYCSAQHAPVTFNYFTLCLSSVLCSGAAVLGDLSASLIKRECKIKDFGNIMPGHGGVLDRFDSLMFVGPMMFLLLQTLPILK